MLGYSTTICSAIWKFTSCFLTHLHSLPRITTHLFCWCTVNFTVAQFYWCLHSFLAAFEKFMFFMLIARFCSQKISQMFPWSVRKGNLWLSWEFIHGLMSNKAKLNLKMPPGARLIKAAIVDTLFLSCRTHVSASQYYSLSNLCEQHESQFSWPPRIRGRFVC